MKQCCGGWPRMPAAPSGTSTAVRASRSSCSASARITGPPSFHRGLCSLIWDASAPCAPRARAQWLPELQAFMCFRLAVRESEAWLLADQEAIARYLAIGARLVPNDPESLLDPKATVVDLARRSSRRSIREDIVPVEGSGRSVGPGYVARLIDFAANHWRVDAAASVSDSLARAVRCLEALRARWVDSLQGA
jgi:hypothetical protein